MRRATMSRVAETTLIYALSALWLLITIYPLVFLLQNSFKAPMEFFTGGVWKMPAGFSLANYLRVWQQDFLRYLGNSVLVVAGAMAVILLAGSAASFALARIRFFSSTFLYYLFVGGLTIPIHITLIPVYIITRRIGLYDTLWALVGPFVAFNLPLTVFILVSFMREIPGSLEEAGYIDGASYWQVFWHVVLPISRPAMTTVGIYNSVILWNEFVFPLVLISSRERRPLTLALWNFQGEFSADVPVIMALLIMTMIPLLLFYAATKERLI